MGLLLAEKCDGTSWIHCGFALKFASVQSWNLVVWHEDAWGVEARKPLEDDQMTRCLRRLIDEGSFVHIEVDMMLGHSEVSVFGGSPSAGKTGGLSGLPQPQGPIPRRGISSSTGSFSLAIDDGPFEEFFDDIPLSRSARKAKLVVVVVVVVVVAPPLKCLGCLEQPCGYDMLWHLMTP